MREPFISVITPVYNSSAVIGQCLSAIEAQGYPEDKLEIIMPDGGSTDNTADIINSFAGRMNIITCENPLKTGEAGKAVGIGLAKGEIIALVDSDNIMPENYIRDMAAPFETEPDIMGTEPLYFRYREEDKPLTKYFAMSGVNDPLCLFIGNYDKYSHITGRWTGFKLKTQDRGGYFVVELDEKQIPTIGANGTFLKREHLLKANYSPYMFDIDVVYEILKTGVTKFAKVKTGIIHIYSPSLSSFVRKQSRRIDDFLHFEKNSGRTYPWASFPVGGVVKFSVYCVTLIPLFAQMIAGFIRKRRWEWVFHPVVCLATLFIYAAAFIRAKLTKKTSIKDRTGWKG
ncbi:MAG TPA: glycosyltransferase [bacterium]|nr:glycosyltransferase [bacterium]